MTLAFAERIRQAVSAGLAIWVIYGRQIDPDGHTCTFSEV